MEKARIFRGKFSTRIIRRAVELCEQIGEGKKRSLIICYVGVPGERWGFDTVDEFLSSYANADVVAAQLVIAWADDKILLNVFFDDERTQITVRGEVRSSIEAVSTIFEEAGLDDRLIPPQKKAKVAIFIGHGRDQEWLKLKSHLQDKHGLDIVSYETGARAGHTIRDILQSMSNNSSFALLVLTGEDKVEDGIRARQNVIHECGLFQGKLGFDRAVLLVEDEVELASNFDGIQQLRFAKGRIAETFGDVIATLRREFGPI